jgi:AraC-like DNA-binding protein
VPVVLDTSGTDVLADVLDSLRLKGRVFCRCELSAPWAIGLSAGDLSHFHIIQRGTCWLRLHGERAIALEEGDLLLVNRGRGYQLSDDPGTRPIPIEDLAGGSNWGIHAVLRHGGGGMAANLLCGGFEFEGPHAQSFLRVLPEWIRVRKDDLRGNEWLDSTARFLQRETQHPAMGAATIVTSLLDVLFVEAVRIWLREQPAAGEAGWLGALRDPTIGAALGLMHQAPEKQWTVPVLSAAVGLSRSPFAARFTALVGQPPMSYLKRWRLQRAAALLRHDAAALSSVAEQVGYESTAAFSRAFTRVFGVSPGRYRYTLSSGRSAPATTSGRKRHERTSSATTSARRERPRP